MKCEWPECKEEAVAKIGLPSAGAMWVCLTHFNIWRKKETE